MAESGPAEIPLTINVVVPDTVLLGDGVASGWVEQYGEVPGDLLREWIAANAEHGVRDWVQRLYQSPKTSQLVAMDQRGRYFEGKLAEFLTLRDRYCRNGWCGCRSGPSTTPVLTLTADPPAPTTDKGSVKPAISPRKAGDGPRCRGRDPSTPSRPSHPRGIATRPVLPPRGPPLRMEIYRLVTQVA